MADRSVSSVCRPSPMRTSSGSTAVSASQSEANQPPTSTPRRCRTSTASATAQSQPTTRTMRPRAPGVGSAAPASRAVSPWPTVGSGVDPEPEAAEERVLVRADPADGGELSDALGIPAAEHDVLRLERGDEPVDRLQHRLPPALLAKTVASPLADVVLERRLPEREVAELHRLELAVDDHRRPEPGSEPEKEHPAS